MRTKIALCVVGLASPAMAAMPPVVGAFERFHRGTGDGAALVGGGILLLNELNCVACHRAPPAWSERLPGRGKIDLMGVGGRIAPDFLRAFVQQPRETKPGTVMPQVVTDDPNEGRALTAYLGSLGPGASTRLYPAGDRARGQRIFNSVGCVACHAPAGEATSYPSVPLGLAAHYNRNALAAFLQNPLHLRPAGRMPLTELTDREASDLAEFLGAKTLQARAVATSADIATGRRLFAAANCIACHTTDGKGAARAAAPLAQLRVERGCLAPSPEGRAARFSLDATQVAALRAALQALQGEETPPAQTAVQKVEARFEQLNCFACHEWRGQGGIEVARSAHFVASDSATESLGELGRVPPVLDQAGRKLTPPWLEKLLWGEHGGVRPYLSARMPRFGRDSGAELVAWLAEASRPERPMEIDTSGSKGHQRSAIGRTLLGTGAGGLGCVNCHGVKDREPNGIHAVNLTATATRIRPEYFKALLLDPQHIQPGTIMPPLFTGRRDANKEIESIWTYFKELDQSPRLPEGLEPPGAFELKPAEEGRTIIFRTFLEGAGVQAVAIGTPSGANAAFDAYEVRWALVWRGRFLDAKSNWEERAMKPVKPLGENVRMVSNLMPLAQLGEPTDAWPAAFGGRAGYSFKGYRVNADGVPTFRYSASGLEVEDTLRPSPDGRTLRRTVKIKGGGEGWYFRGIAADAEPRPVVWTNGEAVIEEIIPL